METSVEPWIRRVLKAVKQGNILEVIVFAVIIGSLIITAIVKILCDANSGTCGTWFNQNIAPRLFRFASFLNEAILPNWILVAGVGIITLATLWYRIRKVREQRTGVAGAGIVYGQLVGSNGQKLDTLPFPLGTGQRRPVQDVIAELERKRVDIEKLPVDDPRKQSQDELKINLGIAYAAYKGYASQEALQEFEGVKQGFEGGWGYWAGLLVQPDLGTAMVIANLLDTLAGHEVDPDKRISYRIEANIALGSTLLRRGKSGDLKQAEKLLRAGYALYNPQKHASNANQFIQDPGVTCLCENAWALWLLGRFNEANTWIDEGMALAGDLSHDYSRTFALIFAAGFHLRNGHVAMARWIAETAEAHAKRYEHHLWTGVATAFAGWARAKQGELAEGIDQMEKGIQEWTKTGASVGEPELRLFQAELYPKVGKRDEGVKLIDRMVDRICGTGGQKATDERVYLPELHRTKGELLMVAPADEEEAEDCFRTAQNIAREQDSLACELRATNGLADWAVSTHQGKRAKNEIKSDLERISGHFQTEFLTDDLKRSHVLIALLS